MTDPISLFFIGLSIFLLGIAKGGFGGAGAPVALPIMALGMPADLALGVLLPLLMTMDVVSLRAHWRNIDTQTVLLALPGAVFGVLAGTWLLAQVSPAVIGGCVGVLAIVFALMALRDRGMSSSNWPNWSSGLFGAVSGVTSTLAHAGGPPIQMYLLSKNYAPQVFVATSAAFMAGVNLIKLGPFIWVGALNSTAALWALALAPCAAAAAYLGVLVSRVISKSMFKLSVNALLLLAGTKLIYDAVFGAG